MVFVGVYEFLVYYLCNLLAGCGDFDQFEGASYGLLVFDPSTCFSSCIMRGFVFGSIYPLMHDVLHLDSMITDCEKSVGHCAQLIL
jgi:hypothetical protein